MKVHLKLSFSGLQSLRQRKKKLVRASQMMLTPEKLVFNGFCFVSRDSLKNKATDLLQKCFNLVSFSAFEAQFSKIGLNAVSVQWSLTVALVLDPQQGSNQA